MQSQQIKETKETKETENFPHKWWALIGLSLLSFTSFLDYTIVNTALPFIQKDLNAGVLQLQWILNIFAMMMSMFMVISGKAGDLFGRKKLFFTGFILFAIAAVGAALSQSIHQLIFFRGVQGFAAAIIATLGVALLSQAFPEKEHKVAVSVFSAFNGTALAAGPFLGGVLITFFSWRSVFWVNIPIIFLGLACCAFTLKPSPAYKDPIRLDLWGLVFLMSSLGFLVYGIIYGEQQGWDLISTWVYIGLGLISFPLLLKVESKHPDPLLDLKIFKNHYAVLSMLLCLSAAFVAYVFMFFDPLYLELMRQQTALMIGITLVFVPLMQIVLSIFLKKLLHVFSIVQLLIAGIVAAMIAAIFHIFFTPTISIIFVIVGLLFMGYNWGISNAGVIVAMTESVPQQKIGAAMGSVFTFWNVGGSIFLALTTILFHWRENAVMQAQLLQQHIPLNADESRSVQSLLADPNQVHTALSHFQEDKANLITQFFQHSFMSAYHCVMIASLFIMLGILIIALLLRKPSKF